MLFTGQGPSGHKVIMDAAEKVGGEDSAARPLELLLLALGGCTGMDVISILRKKRKTVTSMEISLEARQSEDHPRKLEGIKVYYRLRGPDLDEASVHRSVELSEEKYCSVGATLKIHVPVDWAVAVEEAP
jgi:putative redox protein